MSVAFKKAERSQVKLKVGIQGLSGSGKTLGALALAARIAKRLGSGRVALIDTENGSASLYADRFEFDTLDLRPPYESRRYLDAIRAAAEAGYDVLVIDSLSHQWAGEGGILHRKEAVDARGGNHFSNWAPFTKEHEAFKAGLVNAPVHIIATLRTKTEWLLSENDKGKAVPKKLGTAPIQREGMEYEFSLVWELQMEHRGAASKDRTGLFDGRLVDLCEPAVADELVAWLQGGAPVKAEAQPVADAPRQLTKNEKLGLIAEAQTVHGFTYDEASEVLAAVAGRKGKGAKLTTADLADVADAFRSASQAKKLRNDIEAAAHDAEPKATEHEAAPSPAGAA